MVEVMMATLLMAITSIGLIGMFNSSTQLSNLSRQRKEAQRFARTVAERIKAMPFYQPYANYNMDVDDSLWGTASDRGGSITSNDWSTAPSISYTGITDPRYTCTVKMAYVLDNLDTKAMKADWVPKDLTNMGKDKPMSVDAEVFHIIKYEVKVSWQAKMASGKTPTRSEIYTTLMSDTQFQANLGVTTMMNVDPSSSSWGTGGLNAPNAPHTAAGLHIQIVGYGYKAGQTITASMVYVGVADIPISNLTRVDDKNLTGTVDLNTGNTTAPPWQPRRDPGRWTVRVNVGTTFAFAYEAFTVEFPKPHMTASTPTAGNTGNTQLAIKATCDKNVLNLGTGTDPYNTYTGATIRLVNTSDPGIVVDPRDDMNITYQNAKPSGYGTVTGWVQVYFDLSEATPGEYYIETLNCKNNRVALKPGDVASDPSTSFKITIARAIPTPGDVYVVGSNPTELYVNTPTERRHFAYRGRNYKYVLGIEGSSLGAADTVRIGINGDPTQGTSPDVLINATSINNSGPAINPNQTIGDGYIEATFDFSSVPDAFAYNNDTYDYWIYVTSSGDPADAKNLQHILQIRKPRPIVYKNAEYVSGPGAFYHNTTSINTKLTGECFDNSAYNIKYKAGVYSGYSEQTYQVGTSDGSMAKGTPINDGTVWNTQLNLIHCLPGSRNIWVETNDPTPVTDNGFVSTKQSPSYSYSFKVAVVASTGTLLAQSSGAVSITNRFDHWYGTGSPGWVEQILGPTASIETGSTLANAEPAYTSITHYWWIIWPIWQSSASHAESTYSIFTLKCMGLRDAKAVTTLTNDGTHQYGATTVSIYAGTSHASPFYSTSVSLTDPATAAAALTDRSNASLYFTVTTPQLTNVPTSTGAAGIGFTAYDSSYTSVSNWNDGRFNIGLWPNNDSAD